MLYHKKGKSRRHLREPAAQTICLGGRLMELLENHLLINALIAWVTAQCLKGIICCILTHTLTLRQFLADGGMPSGHSATVTALTVTAGLEYGINSPVFAISVILAVVVMHDAMGIRLEAGKHAQALNELWELVNSDAAPDRKMKEVLGHTPLQVLFGGLLGMAIAFLMG